MRNVREEIKRKYDEHYEDSKTLEMAYQRTLSLDKPKEPVCESVEDDTGKGMSIFAIIAAPFFMAPVSLGGVGILLFIGIANNWDLPPFLIGVAAIWGLCSALFALVIGASDNKNKKTKQKNLEKRAAYIKAMEKFNADVEQKTKESNARLVQARKKADMECAAAIAEYDASVDVFVKKALERADSLKEMTDYVTDMFQRAVSHLDNGPEVKFMETDFSYVVEPEGISFLYSSGYSNPLSNYDFTENRFHSLNKPEECEGLAKAIAVLVVKNMKERYPSPLTMVTQANNEAKVTLHFRSANENFAAARDIF